MLITYIQDKRAALVAEYCEWLTKNVDTSSIAPDSMYVGEDGEPIIHYSIAVDYKSAKRWQKNGKQFPARDEINDPANS